MRRPAAFLSAAVSTVLAATLLAAPSAAAADDFTTTLPAQVSVLQPVDVPFQVTSSTGVCEVTGYNGATVSGSGTDWVLHLDPARLGTFRESVTVYVDFCQDYRDYFDVAVTVPFAAQVSPVVSPTAQDSEERSIQVSLDVRDGEQVTVEFLHDGKPVKTLTGLTGDATVQYRVPKKETSGSWSVRTTGAAGVVESPVEVARGWSLLMWPDVLAYPACSTVTWSYSGAGAPGGTAGIKKDIAKALALIGKDSGLTFREVPVGQDAQIKYGWERMGRGGIGGTGGMSVHFSDGDRSIVSTVTLNSQSPWVRKAGFGRYGYGVPARGHLLIHESLHALGLGHVEDRSQVMNPVASSGAPTSLASGDKAGLRYLYHPDRCTG